MRSLRLILVGVVFCGCEVTMGNGQGSQTPTPATSTTGGVASNTPAPTTSTAPAAPRLKGPRVKLATGQDVPVVTGNGDFGGGTQTADSLTGKIYFIPDTSTKVPSLDGLTAVGALYTRELNIAPRKFEQGFPGVDNRFEWFAIRYEGAFTVAAAGAYTFRVNSDDGAIITIDGKVVLENDGIHPPTSKTAAPLQLAAGSHTFRLDYFQGPKYEIALQLYVTPPNGAEKLWSPAF